MSEGVLSKMRRYTVPPFSLMDTSFIARLVSKASKERYRHLEMMGAAYVKETKVPVKYVDLVEEHRPDAIVYYFRDKRKPNPPSKHS